MIAVELAHPLNVSLCRGARVKGHWQRREHVPGGTHDIEDAPHVGRGDEVHGEEKLSIGADGVGTERNRVAPVDPWVGVPFLLEPAGEDTAVLTSSLTASGR